LAGVRVRYLANPDYRAGAILSLWRAREEFDDDLLIMDADVLFPAALLRRLVCAPSPNCFLLDAAARMTGEEQVLLARGGRVLGIVRGGGGGGRGFDATGESVGFLKVCRRDAAVLRAIVEDLVRSGRRTVEHEDAFDRFVKECEVGYVRADDLPWIEIDSPEDLREAEAEVLPKIEALDEADA
jgi:choline kinase